MRPLPRLRRLVCDVLRRVGVARLDAEHARDVAEGADGVAGDGALLCSGVVLCVGGVEGGGGGESTQGGRGKPRTTAHTDGAQQPRAQFLFRTSTNLVVIIELNTARPTREKSVMTNARNLPKCVMGTVGISGFNVLAISAQNLGRKWVKRCEAIVDSTWRWITFFLNQRFQDNQDNQSWEISRRFAEGVEGLLSRVRINGAVQRGAAEGPAARAGTGATRQLAAWRRG